MEDVAAGYGERYPRPERALTAAFVRTICEPGKHFDGYGLYLRVAPNGSKSWVQRIVVRGKRCEFGLGSAALVTLAEDREVALDNRRMARRGGDPLQNRREDAAVMTFEQASRAAHKAHAPRWSNEKHAAQFISTLETYVLPTMPP